MRMHTWLERSDITIWMRQRKTGIMVLAEITYFMEDPWRLQEGNKRSHFKNIVSKKTNKLAKKKIMVE